MYLSIQDTCSLEGKLCVKARKHIKKQRHHFGDKDQYSQSYGFSSSHVQMSELDHKGGWVLKNWWLFFFFFSFIFISWRLITLHIVVGLVIHWHESAMDLHVFPIPIPPSHLPVYLIPLGLPSAPGPRKPNLKETHAPQCS